MRRDGVYGGGGGGPAGHLRVGFMFRPEAALPLDRQRDHDESGNMIT